MTDEQYVAHKFDTQVAGVYGVVPAIIFQYICWRSGNSPVRWIQFTVDELCKQYPYLTPKQVRLALHALVNSGSRTPALVLRKRVCGRSFMYAPVCKDSKADQWHYFDIRIAERLGLVPAIIYQNISWWIKKNWQEHADEYYRYLDPVNFADDWDQMQGHAYQHTRRAAAHHCYVRAWASDHPYIPQRSIERGFSCLLTSKMLVRTYARNRLPVWQFSSKTAQNYIAKSFGNQEIIDFTAKRAIPPPKGQMHRQKGNHAAKRAIKQGLTPSEHRGNQSDGNQLEAPVVRCAHQKLLVETCNPFQQSLAGARSVAGTALTRPAASPSVERAVLRNLNQPNLPVAKSNGRPVKRAYRRRPVPQSEFDLNVMDEMTPEQLAAYVRQ